MSAPGTLEPARPALPGYWRFAWMFFMQPISLHRQLVATGIERPDASGWRLIKQAKAGDGVAKDYLCRLAWMLMLLMPAVVFGGLVIAAACGVEVVWWKVAFGVAFGVAFIPCFLRLPLWPLELIYWHTRKRCLAAAPPHFHELSYLPFPGVRQRMLEEADAHPKEVAALLDVCRPVPGQRGTIAAVEAELAIRELRRLSEQGNWEAAGMLNGRWLPSETSAPRMLLTFRDAARSVHAALQPETSSIARTEHLTTSLRLLEARNFPTPVLLSRRVLNRHLRENERARFLLSRAEDSQISSEGRSLHAAAARSLISEYLCKEPSEWRLAKELHSRAPTLANAWRALIEPMLADAEAEAAKQVPNVFTNTGLSLDPTSERSTARDTFRGREHCIQQVADALEQPQVSLAVIGPRRAGKTSLVKMMTVFLPGDLFIYVDLQSGAGASAEACYQAMDRQLTETLRRHADVRLPRLGERRHFAGVAEWIGELEAAAGRHRVVFCLDEYERLAELWSGGEQELKQLLGLIRSTIQHRRRVRFLIAGTSPLADMPPLWTDHFISAQEIRVDFLDHASAIGLLRKPTAKFPDDAMPPEVAETIYARTAGQPHLLQCFGFRVLQRINKEGRKVVTLNDVEAVEPRVLQDNDNYFADYRNGPEAARAALEALARDEAPEWKPGARHWLRTRGYLTADDQIRVPVFKKWLRRYLEERE